LYAQLALWRTSSGRLQPSSHNCVLKQKPKCFSNTEWRSDGIATSSRQIHWNTWIFSNSDERPDDLPLCLDRCKLELLKLLDTDGHPDGKFSSSGHMLLTNERPDGIPRHPDGCKGTELTDLNSTQSLLEPHN
jgi:hypothetical protein